MIELIYSVNPMLMAPWLLIAHGGYAMYNDSDIVKRVHSLLGYLYSLRYSKFEISIQLGITDKTIYKWEHGTIPSATNYLNLIELCRRAKGTQK